MDAPRSQSAAAPERSKRHTSGDSQGIGEGSGVTAQSAAALVQPVGAKAHPGGCLPRARAADHGALIDRFTHGRQGADDGERGAPRAQQNILISDVEQQKLSNWMRTQAELSSDHADP